MNTIAKIMTCLLLLGGCTTSNLDVETPSKIYTTEEISSLFQKVELTADNFYQYFGFSKTLIPNQENLNYGTITYSIVPTSESIVFYDPVSVTVSYDLHKVVMKLDDNDQLMSGKSSIDPQTITRFLDATNGVEFLSVDNHIDATNINTYTFYQLQNITLPEVSGYLYDIKVSEEDFTVDEDGDLYIAIGDSQTYDMYYLDGRIIRVENGKQIYSGVDKTNNNSPANILKRFVALK